MPVRGLTIIVAAPAPERFRTALSIAAAHAALGGRVRVFCQGEAVAVLRLPIRGSRDDAHGDAGLPVLSTLFEEALGLGVVVIACQSGLQLTATDPASLDRRIGFGGLVGLLQGLGEDRLLAI